MHNLLLRQLKKLNLSQETLPDRDQWQTLLANVDRSYVDYDQEHYFIERSLRISSEEMLALNRQLENAQHVARMGSWTLEMNTGRINWSKELCLLLEFDLVRALPNYQDFQKLIHEEDREQFIETLNKAITGKNEYEIEVRVLNQTTNKYHWYLCIGQPHEFENTMSCILMDITKRRENELKIKDLDQQILITVKQAGMAEVANSVLHNVGNILNSVNVSALLLHKKIQALKMKDLANLVTLLEEHKAELGSFFTDNKKGQWVLSYLNLFAEEGRIEQEDILNEVTLLNQNINRISNVILLQQSMSKICNIIEPVLIPELINNVLLIHKNLLDAYHIKVEYHYQIKSSVVMDKHKVEQILINLISNSIDALMDQKNKDQHKEQRIIIDTFLHENMVSIQVTDTGRGISAENLNKIFNFGFTTKKKGHGFGLHSSALTAKEIGGFLTVASEGINKGATFILNIPADLKQQDGKKRLVGKNLFIKE